MIICPNINSEEYKELVKEVGTTQAFLEWNRRYNEDSSSFEPGFNNNKYEFKNRGKIKHANLQYGRTAMRELFSSFFKDLGVGYEFVSNLDVEKAYKDKSGWVNPDGLITINLDVAGIDTPLHEFGGHIYLASIKKNNPELYKRIIELSLDHSSAININSKYADLDREGVGEEVFAQLFGTENAVKLLHKSSSDKSVWTNIKEAVNESESFIDFFKRIFGKLFGLSSGKNLDINMSDSLQTIIDKLGDDVLYNKASMFASKTEFIKNYKEAISATMTQSALIDKLTDMGFIRKICN